MTSSFWMYALHVAVHVWLCMSLSISFVYLYGARCCFKLRLREIFWQTHDCINIECKGRQGDIPRETHYILLLLWHNTEKKNRECCNT